MRSKDFYATHIDSVSDLHALDIIHGNISPLTIEFVSGALVEERRYRDIDDTFVTKVTFLILDLQNI